MNIIISILLIIGTFFTVVAAIGIVRLPDLYTRMHATTKAGTIGLGFFLLATTFYFQDLSATSRTLGILLFVFITAPVAAHLLGKAMLEKGYQIWKKTD